MIGFLLIDKPATWTSHDVVGYLRKVTKIKKIGHAGTLDPFATGLLIVGIGRAATKRLDEFKGMPKTYEAEIVFGATSDTFDKDGVLVKQTSATLPSKKEIDLVLLQFVGKQLQTPPMFSAKKIKGKKLYELARKGIEVEREPNEITIYTIKRIKKWRNSIHIQVTCSTGTYIRTLVHDIGQQLGCGAYCKELRRTAIGDYSVKKSKRPKQLSKRSIRKRLLSAL